MYEAHIRIITNLTMTKEILFVKKHEAATSNEHLECFKSYVESLKSLLETGRKKIFV